MRLVSTLLLLEAAALGFMLMAVAVSFTLVLAVFTICAEQRKSCNHVIMDVDAEGVDKFRPRALEPDK